MVSQNGKLETYAGAVYVSPLLLDRRRKTQCDFFQSDRERSKLDLDRLKASASFYWLIKKRVTLTRLQVSLERNDSEGVVKSLN
jgi:hypothetical protein